jgi:uncharacterized membrane protein
MVGHDLMVELFRRRLLPYHPQLAYWALCFFGGLASGLIVALLHRGHRNAMLLTSAAAWPLSLLVGWALTLNAIARTRSLQQPLLQIAGDAIAYYLVALTGFVIGGFLFTPASKPGGPSSGRRSTAY